MRILVATDGSELSSRAVDEAIKVAGALEAELIGVSVVLAPPPADGFDGEDLAVRTRLHDVEARAGAAGLRCSIVAEHAQHVWSGILECASRNDVDYIVMASRGLGSLGSLLLGSETQKVLHAADRPVLVVR